MRKSARSARLNSQTEQERLKRQLQKKPSRMSARLAAQKEQKKTNEEHRIQAFFRKNMRMPETERWCSDPKKDSLGETLGTGSWGTVFAMNCDEKKQAIKSSSFGKDELWEENPPLSAPKAAIVEALTLFLLNSFERVKELVPHGQMETSGRIVPLYFGWRYGIKDQRRIQFQVAMERFAGNLLKRSEDRLKQLNLATRASARLFFKNAMVFSRFELERMFRIAAILGGEYGIVHGDLKPDQFLYRNNKAEEDAMHERQKKQPGTISTRPCPIVLVDFGFSGRCKALPDRIQQGTEEIQTAFKSLSGSVIGWQSNSEYAFGKMEFRTVKLGTFRTSDDAAMYNVWNLLLYFMRGSRTFVVDDERQDGTPKKVSVFAGIEGVENWGRQDWFRGVVFKEGGKRKEQDEERAEKGFRSMCRELESKAEEVKTLFPIFKLSSDEVFNGVLTVPDRQTRKKRRTQSKRNFQ